MMFYEALQLKEEIEQQRRELVQLANRNGIKNPTVLEMSQKLDLKVVRLQKIIFKLQAIENKNNYAEGTPFDIKHQDRAI